MKVSPSELHKTSSEFRMAAQETNEIMARLQKVVKNLEESWDDAGQQIFIKYYQEWNNQVVGISELLSMAANELDAIADRYYSADGDLVAEKGKK